MRQNKQGAPSAGRTFSCFLKLEAKWASASFPDYSPVIQLYLQAKSLRWTATMPQ